jgi:hypothetical protein
LSEFARVFGRGFGRACGERGEERNEAQNCLNFHAYNGNSLLRAGRRTCYDLKVRLTLAGT